MADVQGRVAEGYEGVRRAFEENFQTRNEVGAAVAVVVENRLVVDLWGGMADPKKRRPWAEDTMVNMFSVTKGMSALAVAHAHSRGLFDYNERVATYWPEFAANGKEDITVRTLLSHQAGIPAIDEPLDIESLADPDAVAAAIAKQAPAWNPGERHGYHSFSLGFYESELIRRVDPQHRTLGRYFADEIAAPLGLDFYIGLPDDIPDDRIARLVMNWYRAKMIFNLSKLPSGFVKASFNRKSLTGRVFANPKVATDVTEYNNRAAYRIEMPSANGVGTVRSVAIAYGEFAAGGARLGIDADTLDALSQPAALPSSGTLDEVLRIDTVFSLGVMKPFPGFQFGSPQAFGTPGFGGSMGLADPALKMGFCYAMNRAGYHIFNDPREQLLRDAAMEAARATTPTGSGDQG
jgi:CubicO group peptidase (beta-lactamase class C family)